MKAFLILMMVLIPFSQASAVPFGVSANPLWTNIGISVLATDTVSFTGATADWTYQFGVPQFGPEGSSTSFQFDQWITNGQSGQLIGFIGNAALDLNADPRVIQQNDPGLFAIGAGPLSMTGLAGNLWLGFNDGYVTFADDNGGSASVNVNVNGNVSPVPEPATLILLGTTAAGLGLARWRQRKQGQQ